MVADEAHAMKNPATRDNRAMSKIATRRRLALTGYPLQNVRGHAVCAGASTWLLNSGRCVCGRQQVAVSVLPPLPLTLMSCVFTP